MTNFYFYLVLLNAGVSLTAAWMVFWRNRHQVVGPLWGLTLTVVAVWLVGFAQYFRPLDTATALWWAKLTLTASIINHPLYIHAMYALVGRLRRMSVWIGAAYLTAGMFIWLLWNNQLITEIRPIQYMHHYVQYNRTFYPWLSAYILFWAGFGLVVLVRAIWQAVGYQRTQLIYFAFVSVVFLLTTDSIILPLEYGIDIQPVGFFVLPMNMVLLAYVLARARLADYNVVVAWVLIHSLTLVIVVLASLVFVGGMALAAPGFMNPSQTIFTVMLVVVIGMALASTLPRWLPRAERLMQERMFGDRFGYQDVLAGAVREIVLLPTTDEVVHQAATTIQTHMQVARVLVLLQDSLSGRYVLQAESGLPADESTEGLHLDGENSALIAWLRDRRDALVADEISRTEPEPKLRPLLAELARLKVSTCIPLVLEDLLIGVIALGPKANRDAFFASDLKVLGNLATEVALAVKYRRMEDQILRKNKLIELGTIAAGVAHEIRNPLASIRTFAQLLPDKMDDPEFKNEFSKLVLKDVDRITKVVESMLAFARPAQVQIAEHKATDLVEEAVLLVQSKLKGKRIELSREFHDQPVLRVDKQQILQVLVNLLSNAADALPEQGKIRVATGVRALEGGLGANGAEKYGVIEVADNGPGIPAAVRQRIFDPFFTTKKEGTGLGLSISQKIARDHGGIITCSSVDGKGTTFQVSLPLTS